MFWVSVPVLSEKTYSIWPKSSEIFHVFGTQGVSSGCQLEVVANFAN